MADTITVQVGNLAHGVTEAELRSAFAPAGDVVAVRILTDRRGRQKGLATVSIRADDADALLEQVRGTSVSGRAMDVWLADAARGGGGRAPRRRRR